MSTANKLSYLNDTKSLLRTSLNKFGSSILSTDTFRSYDTKLNDIYDKLPKVTQSGAGFTLSDVQNGQVDDFKMIGVDLEQNTTETIIINEWEQGDISGSTGDTISDNSTIRTQQYIKVFPNVLYNISRTIYNSFMKFRFYDTNYNFLGTQGNVNITTNVSEDRMTANVSSMQLTINDSSVAYMKISDASNNLNTIYTITTNDTPSPIYPQEIKVVEGRQVITDKGKNKFYLNNNYSANYDEASIEVNNNNSFILRMNKTSSNKQNPCATIEFNASYLKPNTTYTISKKNSNTGYVLDHVGSIRLYTNGSYGNFIDADEYTFTTPNEITSFKILLYLFFNNSTTGNYEITFYDIQLEENSTATDYEPYYEPVSYNIDLHGKNVFNLEKYPFTPKVAYSSTGYQELNWTGYSGIKDYFPINGNTTYSFSNSTGLDIYYGLVFYDKNKTIISNITAHTTTFTTPSNCEYIRFSIHTEELPTWVQIEEGSTTTNYEEYYDYKLAKMPNTTYKNRIYKDNGNWYFEENVKKIVLDGSEDITLQNTVNNIIGVRLPIGNNVKPQTRVYCSHLKDTTFNNYYDHRIYGMIASHGSQITTNLFASAPNESIITIDQYKNWLSTNNTTVYCILVNPVTTQITNTTLINQLEAISLHTGTNIITISNDNNIIPEIEITRLKELEKLA